jgi:hypothetical protein
VSAGDDDRSIYATDPALPHGFGSVSGRMPRATVVDEPWQDPAYCNPAAFFDALIGRQDRHYGNYRYEVRVAPPPLS